MRLVASICSALLCGAAYADQSLFLQSFQEVKAVPAVQEFCERFPQECVKIGSLEPVALTPERRTDLHEINATVNHRFKYETDGHLYGMSERWELNTRHGDCEDFAIRKRHLLIERGWPSSALLLTIVRAPEGSMHALLVARTAEGDFVLDKTLRGADLVRPWFQTRYLYVAQQSPHDPHRWMSLLPRAPDLTDMPLRWWTADK